MSIQSLYLICMFNLSIQSIYLIYLFNMTTPLTKLIQVDRCLSNYFFQLILIWEVFFEETIVRGLIKLGVPKLIEWEWGHLELIWECFVKQLMPAQWNLDY